MGKRSKSGTEHLKVNKSAKSKKIKFVDNSDTEETPKKSAQRSNIPEDYIVKNKKTKKRNKDNLEKIKTEECKTEPAALHSSLTNINLKSKKRNKGCASKDVPAECNKIQTTEESSEIITTDKSFQTKIISNKEKKSKNADLPQEDDVKDEDIDNFCDDCDEITEEDNEQYENWVKLIEANLSGNKKKPK